MRLKILLLFSAGLLGLPSISGAVSLAENSPGQVLIFPYYNTHNEKLSLLSVSNTRTDRSVAMAISARTLGDAELSFIVYLAPSSTWTGALYSEATGARLYSSDGNCRHPRQQLQGAVDLPRSGFLIAYELGVLRSASALQAATRSRANSWGTTWSNHRPEERNDCDLIAAAWADAGVWNENPSTDMDAPANSLSGHLQIVETRRGIGFSLQPLVLQNFSDAVLHRDVTRHSVTLDDARPPRSQVRIGQEEIESNWTRGVDAVSATLMSRSAATDVWLVPEIGAESDVTFTFPTWAFYDASRPGPFASNDLLSTGVRLTLDLRDRNGLPYDTFVGFCDPPPPTMVDSRPLLDRAMLSFATSISDPLDPSAERLHGMHPAPGCGGFWQTRVIQEFTGRLIAFAAPIENSGYGEPRQSFRSIEGHVYPGLPGIVTALSRARTDDWATPPGQPTYSYGFGLPTVYQRQVIREPRH